MKLPYVIRTVLLLSIIFSAIATKAQQNEDLLNLLIKKKVLSQQEADSIRADEAIKEQAKKENSANRHGISIGRALQISGLVQARYQGFEQSNVNNSFDLRRVRLDLRGNITDRWSYDVYTEFGGTGVKLVDAFVAYTAGDYLKFSAGQFKIPFSVESLTSDSQLEFSDRSQVVEALVSRTKDVIGNSNGRDIGIMVNGSFAKIDDFYLFDYSLGVFNGAGYDVTTDNNNHKDISGRLSVHPVKNLSVSADFYNGQGNYGTPATNQKRNRTGVDARYVWKALSLTAEYDKGTDGKINRSGWYGQAAYFILPKHLQLAAKYDTYDPTQTSLTDRSNWYTGGVNYYFNDWTRLTIDYTLRREQTTQVKNNLLNAQLQIVF
ncbi:porin [Mucilaginibacter sp. OK098]|uniref:porin n=1 Tax=Mucilaginibacter sp. OK098 TaxID=1855297 RepID=UPI00091C1CF0|nr:porin [Mucilaginibacter sp. OK098]SHM09120.1 Phosphate-selective porin [Mucilaginibacter sp. OK098]